MGKPEVFLTASFGSKGLVNVQVQAGNDAEEQRALRLYRRLHAVLRLAGDLAKADTLCANAFAREEEISG